MSMLARQRRQAAAARLATLTPAERVAIAVRLGQTGLASFMITQRVDRETAIRQIKATRRLGRRPSPSADER